ncbi:hypothetical protein ES692_13330 [Psychroserpens burtonensis]|uniref:Lipoprotein n=1 Tax=Psychroserpens burtonensis TaxID=49278 RepID=A0A5C7BDT1_9FLAO|nr:hypothetical protein [Psychroserpens burtonensis]TXE16300.1 hypothetical protein ES692_13330 [Psychroserpens burtonensis]
MKKTILYLCLLCLTIVTSCNNDDDQPQDPISQLPPATQTGERTFGALLDGEPFIPRGGINPLDCVYQSVNGEYYFGLQGNKRNDNNNLILIGLGTNNLEIDENITYALGGTFSETNTINAGQLSITHLDLNAYTVSGTFWFDIIDQNGNLRQIREGRFDMPFTN